MLSRRCSVLSLAVLAANAGLAVSLAPPVLAQGSQALEEVVVTARKRVESVQDVPIAVSAFSGDQLKDAGVANLKDMAMQVPGLQIDSQSTAQIWIRGVGQRDDSARVDSPVGVYIDGIYIARKDAQLLDMVDVESLSVLRGPQGTLFGKNTTAGALVITSRKPTDEYGGRLETRLGNLGRRDAKVVVNVPIIEEKLLSKLSLSSVKRDGYMENVATGDMHASEDRQAAALQLHWAASDSVSVDTFAYAGKTREIQPSGNCQLMRGSGYGGSDPFYQNMMWPGDVLPVWNGEYLPSGNPALDPGRAQGSADRSRLPAGYVDTSRAYADACNTSNALLDDDKVITSDPPKSRYNLDNYLVGVTVDWEISDDLSFKSVTGWGSQRLGPYATYGDNEATSISASARFQTEVSRREQISQEFQITGAAMNDALQYTAGLFAMKEELEEGEVNQFGAPYGGFFPNTPILLAIAPTVQQDNYDLENTTLAAFFQTSYDITENLQGTVGLRWTSEQREQKLVQRTLDENWYFSDLIQNQLGLGFNVGGAALITAPISTDPFGQIYNALLARGKPNGVLNYQLTDPTTYNADQTWEELSPMASLAYTLPDSWLEGTFLDEGMVYFTYSEGFKSGTFEPVGGDGLATVDPETLKNFEVGFKLDAFERSVRLNVAAYHMEYDNMQLRQVIADSSGSPAVVLTNASKSEIEGVEMEFTWQPIENLLLMAGASYNDYDYISYTDKQLSAWHLLSSLPPPEVDRSGENFAEVPEVTANLAVQYTFDIGVGTLTPRVQYNYVGEVYLGLDAGAWSVKDQSTVDSYGIWSARLAYLSPDQRFSLALYGNNLNDEEYFQGAAAVGDTVGSFTLQKAPPRMFGLELSYRFGAL